MSKRQRTIFIGGLIFVVGALPVAEAFGSEQRCVLLPVNSDCSMPAESHKVSETDRPLLAVACESCSPSPPGVDAAGRPCIPWSPAVASLLALVADKQPEGIYPGRIFGAAEERYEGVGTFEDLNKSCPSSLTMRFVPEGTPRLFRYLGPLPAGRVLYVYTRQNTSSSFFSSSAVFKIAGTRVLDAGVAGDVKAAVGMADATVGLPVPIAWLPVPIVADAHPEGILRHLAPKDSGDERPDADAAPRLTRPRGCSCEVGGKGEPFPAWLLVLLVVGIRRRSVSLRTGHGRAGHPGAALAGFTSTFEPQRQMSPTVAARNQWARP